MESIIIFIIATIVTAFFKGKGKEKEQTTNPAKPFTATGRVPDNPQGTLKEKSKELYREWQKELQREDVEPPSRQLQPTMVPQPPVAPSAPVQAIQRTERSQAPREERQRESRHSGRLSAHGGTKQVRSVSKTHELMPRTEQDLLKGIVFSEIFGPPKSKR